MQTGEQRAVYFMGLKEQFLLSESQVFRFEDDHSQTLFDLVVGFVLIDL